MSLRLALSGLPPALAFWVASSTVFWLRQCFFPAKVCFSYFWQVTHNVYLLQSGSHIAFKLFTFILTDWAALNLWSCPLMRSYWHLMTGEGGRLILSGRWSLVRFLCSNGWLQNHVHMGSSKRTQWIIKAGRRKPNTAMKSGERNDGRGYGESEEKGRRWVNHNALNACLTYQDKDEI